MAEKGAVLIQGGKTFDVMPKVGKGGALEAQRVEINEKHSGHADAVRNHRARGKGARGNVAVQGNTLGVIVALDFKGAKPYTVKDPVARDLHLRGLAAGHEVLAKQVDEEFQATDRFASGKFDPNAPTVKHPAGAWIVNPQANDPIVNGRPFAVAEDAFPVYFDAAVEDPTPKKPATEEKAEKAEKGA